MSYIESRSRELKSQVTQQVETWVTNNPDNAETLEIQSAFNAMSNINDASWWFDTFNGRAFGSTYAISYLRNRVKTLKELGTYHF